MRDIMAVNSPWLCSSSNSTLFGGLVYSRRWYHMLLSLSLSLSLSSFQTLSLYYSHFSILNSHFISRQFVFAFSFYQKKEIIKFHIFKFFFFFFLVIAIYSSYGSSYNSYKFTNFLHRILRNLTVKKISLNTIVLPPYYVINTSILSLSLFITFYQIIFSSKQSNKKNCTLCIYQIVLIGSDLLVQFNKKQLYNLIMLLTLLRTDIQKPYYVCVQIPMKN